MNPMRIKGKTPEGLQSLYTNPQGGIDLETLAETLKSVITSLIEQSIFDHRKKQMEIIGEAFFKGIEDGLMLERAAQNTLPNILSDS